MLKERPLHADVKTLLLANKPFSYAHLIKFERPSRPDSNSGIVSTSKERYTYLCDASRDVDYDDGSVSNSGAANGTQTYRANKVIQVSSVTEDTEAKASSYSITLDGNGVGAYISGTATISLIDANTYDIVYSGDVDLLAQGFREGDKVTFSGLRTGDFNIQTFRAKNTIRVGKIDSVLTAGTGTLTATLASEEIVSILLNKNTASYASFINREVFIYRAYFQDGTLVGTPFLLFKGIISSVNFDDGDNLTVSWGLSSHWGDFSQVKGRITSDDFHRALDQNGIPQPQSTLKVSYAYDKGFAHAETSLNILAKYSTQVEKQTVKAKSGFFGIGAKVKVKKYFETQINTTQLDFQLQAKSIPIVYGVRTVEGVPIFADTLNNDSSTVYVIEALSEGEIGGLYDVYIDGNSLICNNKADFDLRSTQTETEVVNLICRGRADRGDVLGGTLSTNPAPASSINFFTNFSFSPATAYLFTLNYDLSAISEYAPYIEPTTALADTTGAGITDGQSISLTSPQAITIDLFSGKPGQKAASSLVTVAQANNFKIQNDYWSNTNTADYWSPNHRLLDTAYVVTKHKIEEGETSIKSTEYVVRGKVVDCYNYDYSYSHSPKVTGESAANFQLGDTVALQTIGGSVLNASVQIIDKWTFANPDGTLNTRFRFSVTPSLGYVNSVPATTTFKMVSGANNWTMVTYNYSEFSGTIATEWLTAITGTTNSGNYVQFNFATNAALTIGGDPSEDSSAFSVVDSSGNPVSNNFFGYAVLIGTISSTSLITKYSHAAAGASATATVGQYLVRRNIITLPAGASATDSYYNNYTVNLSRVDTLGRKTTQSYKIISYVGASRVATIDGLWDYGFHPKSGDTVTLTPAYTDARVTINSALQLMDYVTSTTYGRGLNPFTDLNFPSWLETARLSDVQSNVTVASTNTGISPTVGNLYRFPATGTILWQGQVVGSNTGYVEFTNVIGKLTNKWNSWKNYALNELVYNSDKLYQVASAGVKTTAPTHSSGTTNGLAYVSAVSITSGANSIPLVVDGNPVRGSKNGITVSGYSLYDCDGVDYWRLLGWDEFTQRFVTKHQTNLVVDTSLPLLDNINSILQHFGGIMRYSGGQYYLDIEAAEPAISNATSEPRNITADEIIGKIRLTDDGIRSAFNSLTASYSDPATKFEARNISFFNSNYLKADRGVPKKGNLTVPGITNYYNTRILADKFLNQSRFGLTGSFNMRPSGALLLAGTVIQLQYPRYNWVDKKFRILNLTHQNDTSVDLTVEEYDDSFYNLSNITKQEASGVSGSTTAVTAALAAPTGLIVTSIEAGDPNKIGIELNWINNPNIVGSQNVSTEIYSSYSTYLFVYATNITSNVITTQEAVHGLKIGELVHITSTSFAGLAKGSSYFIKTIPAANQFTVSDTKGGAIKGLTNSSGISYAIRTADLISTVDVPVNSYTETITVTESRVIKYYWVRHRIITG